MGGGRLYFEKTAEKQKEIKDKCKRYFDFVFDVSVY